MSDFAKTLHLPAILGGFWDFKAALLNSSMVNPSLDACWSRNEPVPAAQTPFIAKSAISIFLVASLNFNKRSFESSPPISIAVLTSGWKRSIALACAMTSLIKLPPISSLTFLPAEPVTPTLSILSAGILVTTSERTSITVFKGWPLVLV